jgi:hypothetical protein
VWGIGKRTVKIGCSEAEINENKMSKRTFLLGHPLIRSKHYCQTIRVFLRVGSQAIPPVFLKA